MKWMRWSWEDYTSAPQEIVDEIVVMINEEREYWERRKAGLPE